MGNEYIYAIVDLLLILVAVYCAFYLLKKFKFSRMGQQKLMNIVQVLPIGSKEKIVLVKFNDTHILLGATANHIEKIHVFSATDSFETLAAQALDNET